MQTRSALSLAVSTLVLAGAATAQVTTYDVATGVVTIPSVMAGGASFTNVTLLYRGDSVFDFTGGVEQLPAMPGDALTRYDLVTGVLTLPAVKVGNETFLDVTLLNVGNFVFTLQTATALPASVSADVTAFFRSAEQMLATAVPASGAARIALGDSCWAGNGRTRANFIADWDANSAEYVRCLLYTSQQVLAQQLHQCQGALAEETGFQQAPGIGLYTRVLRHRTPQQAGVAAVVRRLQRHPSQLLGLDAVRCLAGLGRERQRLLGRHLGGPARVVQAGQGFAALAQPAGRRGDPHALGVPGWVQFGPGAVSLGEQLARRVIAPTCRCNGGTQPQTLCALVGG